MSGAFEEKVLAAHPLALPARMVLFMLARETKEGQADVLVNRAALARRLETTPDVVRRSLTAGEQAGLLLMHRNGVVQWLSEELPLVDRPAPRVETLVQAGQVPELSPGQATKQWVMGEFARLWEDHYRQRYVFTPGKDHKLASALATTHTSAVVLTRAMRAYIADEDPFYARCKHAFSVFTSCVMRFVAEDPEEEEDEYDRIERQTRERLREVKRGA